MTKPDLLVVGNYPDWDIQALTRRYTLVRLGPDQPLQSLGTEQLAAIEAMAMKGHREIGEEMFSALPALRIIANYGVGFDTIDVKAAGERGIAVTYTPDVLSDDVADHTIGMMIARAKDFRGAEDWVRSGQWEEKGEFTLQHSLRRKSVGIVGLGRIGRAIAERLEMFKMKISYLSREPKRTPDSWSFVSDPVELAKNSDFLIIALAGGMETAGLVTKEVIHALGPSGMLVNVSRGSTVDEEALIDALSTGALGSAALDVFLNEPRIDPRFLALPNVFLQPHHASATVETRSAMGALQRENLAAYFEKRPLPTPVNNAARRFPN